MKTLRNITLALALAATSFHAVAQSPKPEPKEKPLPPPPKERGERAEFRFDDLNDENRSFGFAQTIVGDAEHNVRRVFAGAGEPDQPLIISTGALDESAVSNLEEDLAIMARILEKSVNRGNGQENGGDRKAMGIHLWALGQANRGARDLYIDGHGAIFILNANIPLTGPAKTSPEEKKEPGDSAWESTRDEIFGNEKEPRKGRRERVGPSFDPGRIEGLKKNLIESLKNAANIRGLKDNESVTVVVQEPGGGGGRIVTGASNNRSPKNPPGNFDVFAIAPDGRRSSRTLLTLRAKKSDIEAFSKGKFDVEEFRKKVTVSSYQTGASGDPGRSKQ
jgi:hypothetical protein